MKHRTETTSLHVKVSRRRGLLSMPLLLVASLALGAASSRGQDCSISISLAAPTPTDTIRFHGTSVLTNLVVSWNWDFGDGATAPGNPAFHRYEREGAYEVSLTAVDTGGNTATCAMVVEVNIPGRWQKLNGPYGAYIAEVLVDPLNPQVLYAALDGGGVAKSYDAGATWSLINNGLADLTTWDMVLHPAEPQTIYAATFWGGVFKTANGGTNWSRVFWQPGEQTWAVTQDPVNPEIVYASGTRGIYQSTNGGVNWNARNTGLLNTWISAVAVDPTMPNVLYAANWASATNWIYKTIDQGEHWAPASFGLNQSVGINSIAVDPSNPMTLYAATDAGLFKSTTGGEEWAFSSAGIPNQSIRHVVVDAMQTNLVYAATWGGLFMSFNGGQSWNLLSQTFMTPYVKTVTVGPQGDGTLYAGIFGSVYRSPDRGATWTSSQQGLELDIIVGMRTLFVDPLNPNSLFVGTYGGGMFKTIDGGMNWASASGGIDIPMMNGGGGQVPAAGAIFACSDGGGVYKSTDSGALWISKTLTGRAKIAPHRLLVDPMNPQTVYLAARGGLFKSIDAGEIWFPIENGIAGLDVRDLALDPHRPFILFAGTKTAGLFKSMNAGNSWQPAGTGITDPWIEIVRVDPVNSNIVYAATRTLGSSGVFKSMDGGNTWSNSSAGIPGLFFSPELLVNPSNPRVLYVGTFGTGIFKSLDGGATWKPWNNGLLDLNMSSLVFDPRDPSVLYAGCNIGVYRFTPSLICQISLLDTMQLLLSWNPLPGMLYTVESTSSLADPSSWAPVPPLNQWPTPGTNWVGTPQPSQLHQFYRVVAVAAP